MSKRELIWSVTKIFYPTIQLSLNSSLGKRVIPNYLQEFLWLLRSVKAKIFTPDNFLSKCNLYRELLEYLDLQTMTNDDSNHISKYDNLIISPDKDLNNIPFETLGFNGKLAIESFNMSYVLSFSVLKLMHEAGIKNYFKN